MTKGISPLVAAVILIAVTMTIAGILSFWATSFVQKGLPEVENTTQQTICLGAKFRVYSGSYNSTSQGLALILENQRNVDLTLDKLYIFYPNNRLETYQLSGILANNELKPINVSNIEDGFEYGQIRTNCPEVYASFTYSEVVK